MAGTNNNNHNNVTIEVSTHKGMKREATARVARIFFEDVARTIPFVPMHSFAGFAQARVPMQFPGKFEDNGALALAAPLRTRFRGRSPFYFRGNRKPSKERKRKWQDKSAWMKHYRHLGL